MFTDENYLRSPNYIFEDKINDSWNENEGELDDDLNSNFLNNNSKVVDFDEESFQNENEENEETRANSNQHELSNNKLPVKEIDVDMNKTKTKIIVLRIKNGRLDYLYKKTLIMVFKEIREILNKNNSKSFKRINFGSDITYKKLRMYLGTKIEELLKKNDKNIPLIESKKRLSDECQNILKMNLEDFINLYKDKRINDKYEEYFQNEFMKKYKNAESFEEYNSIGKLIYKIKTTKGNIKNSNKQQ